MGIFEPPNIEKMKANKNVKGLAKAMRYRNDQRVRYEAVLAMEECGMAAVEPLIAALGVDINYTESKAIVRTLGKIGAPAIDPLITVLKEMKSVKIGKGIVGRYQTSIVEEYRSNHDVLARVAMAADALGEIGDVRAVEPLIHTCQNAYDRYGGGSDPYAPSRLIDRQTKAIRASVGVALVKIGEPAIERFIEVLHDRRNYSGDLVRATIVWVLGEIGDLRAVDELVVIIRYKSNRIDKGLAHPADTELALDAANALAKIGDPRAAEPMMDILQKGLVSMAIPLSNFGGLRSIEAIVGIIGVPHGGAWTIQDEDYVVNALCNLGETALNELPRSNNENREAVGRVTRRVQECLRRRKQHHSHSSPPPVDKLLVPEKIKYTILHGEKSPGSEYPSRSEAVFAVVMALIDAGYDESVIAALLLDKRHAISRRPLTDMQKEFEDSLLKDSYFRCRKHK